MHLDMCRSGHKIIHIQSLYEPSCMHMAATAPRCSSLRSLRRMEHDSRDEVIDTLQTRIRTLVIHKSQDEIQSETAEKGAHSTWRINGRKCIIRQMYRTDK